MSATERRNNWRHFQGDAGRQSLQRARGFAPGSVFGDDLQSGGIHAPRVRKIGVDQGPLIRFFSGRKPITAEAGGWHGNWWITRQCFASLRSIAMDNREPLATVAGRFLFVPAEWSDLQKCVVGALTLECWAYEGKGKFYAHSPPAPRQANAGFKTETDYDAFKKSDKLYGYAPKDAAYQLYIPGDAADFREMMTIRTGWTSAFSTGEIRP